MTNIEELGMEKEEEDEHDITERHSISNSSYPRKDHSPPQMAFS